MIIDAHHHFWQYDPAQYGWISEQMGVLRRDFLPEDLKPQLLATGVDGVVSVQARQSLEETRWLLEMADNHAFIRGVVGWVPLIAGDVQRHLDSFAGHRKLRAVRHVLQDETDPAYMLRDDFLRGLAALRPFGLVYDILIYEHQLRNSIAMVDRHPDQVFVLDHLAKPRIRDGLVDPWRDHLRELARRPHVFCKISGLATEADHAKWTSEQLRPYIETALEAFGPDRLMFGSDWPVCLLATSYERWFNVVREATAGLSDSEQAAIWGRTAIRAYGLDDSPSTSITREKV